MRAWNQSAALILLIVKSLPLGKINPRVVNKSLDGSQAFSACASSKVKGRERIKISIQSAFGKIIKSAIESGV